MISLVKLLTEDENDPQHFGTSTAGGQPLPATSVDYNVSSDFSDFEAKIARTTAESKAAFLQNLNNRVLGKKVSIQASKGYGQPVRDYEISVTSTSLDYFYDRYVVILRDEDDKNQKLLNREQKQQQKVDKLQFKPLSQCHKHNTLHNHNRKNKLNYG